MSTNCVVCIKNERTGFDLLCDECRESYYKNCHYYEEDPVDFVSCSVTEGKDTVDAGSVCSYCPYGKIDPSTVGVNMIRNARRKQITKGYTLEHDKQHNDGSLSVVAAMLALYGTDAGLDDAADRSDWGLIEKCEGKGHDYSSRKILMLAIAGAMIAAEIDRMSAEENETE